MMKDAVEVAPPAPPSLGDEACHSCVALDLASVWLRWPSFVVAGGQDGRGVSPAQVRRLA
jgi:hypothetical protein